VLATATATAPGEGSTPALRRPPPLLLIAGVIVALGNAVAQPIRALGDLADTDYVYAFMTAARMLHQGTSCLYCHNSARAVRATFIQTGATSVNDLYSNPPLAAWVIQPIALLPAEASLAVFLGLSIAAIVGAGAIMGTRLLPGEMPATTRAVVVVLAITTLPAMQALSIVNWDGVLVAAVAAAAWAARARRPMLAGALLSVLLVKPQTVWLVPLIFLVTVNWPALAGFLLGAATWVASTLLLIGPGQVADWAHNDLPMHSAEAHQTIGIPALAAELSHSGSTGFAVAALLVIPVAALAWRFRGSLRADPATTVGLGVAVSVLCAPHVWPQDLLLVSVAVVLWARRQVPPALVATAALSLAFLLDTQLPLGGDHLEALVLAGIVLGLGRALVIEPRVTRDAPSAPPRLAPA
jgi:hypothetical protein